MAYSKLFASIVHSSLWTSEDHVRLLFVTLLALADSEGFVYGSRNGLERAANIVWRENGASDPWDDLMGPDPDSSDLMRNPDNEGRRIEEVEGGFRILNFVYYRSLRNSDDRRAQNREAQRRFRKTHKPSSATVSQESSESTKESAKVSQSKPISDAEAEAEAEAYVLSSKERTKERADARPKGGFSERKKEVMLQLRQILPKHEMDEFGDLWAKRVKHCWKAVAYAIEDYKLIRDNPNTHIKNIGAWLTDRHARALVDLKNGEKAP